MSRWFHTPLQIFFCLVYLCMIGIATTTWHSDNVYVVHHCWYGRKVRGINVAPGHWPTYYFQGSIITTDIDLVGANNAVQINIRWLVIISWHGTFCKQKYFSRYGSENQTFVFHLYFISISVTWHRKWFKEIKYTLNTLTQPPYIVIGHTPFNSSDISYLGKCTFGFQLSVVAF